jgi:hypothetical protein
VIRQVEQYHGAALARLCKQSGSPGLRIHIDATCRSAYVLDDRAVLYLKYSTNRLSPWTFSFSADHQEDISHFRDRYEEVFTVLICGTDGIACLSGTEYDRVLDDDPRSGEWIKAARRARQKYSITGSDDRTIHKIGDNEFPAKVYTALGRSLGDVSSDDLWVAPQ